MIQDLQKAKGLFEEGLSFLYEAQTDAEEFWHWYEYFFDARDKLNKATKVLEKIDSDFHFLTDEEQDDYGWMINELHDMKHEAINIINGMNKKFPDPKNSRVAKIHELAKSVLQGE